MELIPFKKPMIANVQNITSLSEQFELGDVYIHLSFLKPGKHTYIVRKTYMELERGEDDDKHGFTTKIMQGDSSIKVSQSLMNEIKRKKLAMDREFYVHELLASVRPEEIPECK